MTSNTSKNWRANLALWREALEELSRRKLRTGLTLLGLIFGIGAIVAMQAVGEGSQREALKLGDVMQPIRVALTGGTVSEPVHELLAVVGRDEALRRMSR